VVTGECQIGGVEVVLVVLDFGFMGGSIGSVVGEKVALSFELAARKGKPLVTMVTGGGVRIQEGLLSLMQMAKTVTAANGLKEKGFAHIAVLANPSTGPAYASFANLADLVFAEPGSLMGLASLQTLKEVSSKPLPVDAHTAEAHLNRGLIDQVVDRENLRDTLITVLNLLTSRNGKTSLPKKELKKTKRISLKPKENPDASLALEAARHPQRPTTHDYIEHLFSDFIELRGDRINTDDRSIIGGIGRLDGMRVMVIGHQRPPNEENPGHVYPEGLRKAQRLMALAAKFKLPLITLVDTRGAFPGLQAEEHGIGNALANTISLMAELPTPIVSVIIGEGGCEGALALSVSDLILMNQYAIYSPISPEGAAQRIFRDATRSKEAAEVLKLTAKDCLDLGIVDGIVAEPEGGAHNDPTASAQNLRVALLKQLSTLIEESPKKLVKTRYKKFRRMGEYSTYFKQAVQRELELLKQFVLRAPPTGDGQAPEAEKADQGAKDKKAKTPKKS
jgi:acetyl-CoA carboxylase carboxyl transferase subunit beta